MHPADQFPHLLQRVLNAPLALRLDKAEIVLAALAQRLGTPITLNGRNLALDGDDGLDIGPEAEETPKGYDLVGGKIAVIYVAGTLVHKLGSLRPWSGMTGYNGIRANLNAALDDNRVKGIVLDVDSPGGECAGCFDLADTIFAARKEKPIWAICSESAYSAGYALASAASKVIVPRTGGVGSIGIICMHVDLSRGLSKAGIAVTLLKYGDNKDNFAETAPLSKKAFDAAMADINTMGAMFDALVARNRGIAAAKVKSYQAGTFMGARGQAAGLADAIMPPDRALREFLKTL